MRFHCRHFVLIGFLAIGVLSLTAGVSGAVVEAGLNETESISTQDPDEVTVASELQNESGDVQVFIEFESPPDGESVEALQSHASESQADFRQFAEESEGVTLETEFWLTSAAVATVDMEAVSVESLAAIEGVTRIQPPVTVEIDAVETQSADSVSLQSDAKRLGDNLSEHETTYGLDQIGAPETWETYDTQGEGVSVAVLDTGVDDSHPDIDLCSTCWAEFDSSGNAVSSEPNDGNGHGTHVSGTVAGGNESGEYIGVAPGVELLHGKVLDDDGSGTMSQIIAGMEWAVEEDVDVLSMSLGTDDYADEFVEPVRNAEEAGVTVVASAGNSGEETSSSPGNFANSINVGATDAGESVLAFSSGEEITTEEAWEHPPSEWPESYVVPTVAAPGSLVMSADPEDEYVYRSGTSMAAPHVAGAVALIQAGTGEEFSNDELEAALVETAWKPDSWEEPDDEPDVRYGAGIVDVPEAIDELGGGEATFTVRNATMSEETVLEGESVETAATVENTGTGEGTFTATLLVDGAEVESTWVVLEPDESETVAFERTFADAGEYEIAVNGESAGTLTVEQPATLAVQSLAVSPEPVVEHDPATMTATVANEGDRAGNATVQFTIDEEPVANRSLELASGESTDVVFEHTFTEAGEYDIAVGEYTRTVTVEAADTNEVPGDIDDQVTEAQYTVFLPAESETPLSTIRENVDEWVDDREVEGVEFTLADVRVLIDWWADNR